MTTDDTIDAITFTIFYLTTFMHIPGQIENWNLIIDFAKLGITKVPKDDMKHMLKVLNCNMRCKGKRVFILNTTSLFNVIWKFA